MGAHHTDTSTPFLNKLTSEDRAVGAGPAGPAAAGPIFG